MDIPRLETVATQDRVQAILGGNSIAVDLSHSLNE
jgi:hypothetical protein